MTGIYLIKNKITKKIYIGSAISINKRWNVHRCELRNNKHHSILLQRAWNLYYEEAFIFEILEICSKEKLVEREQYYLDTLNPEYNICKIAESCTGRVLNESSRLKISIGNKGRKHSEETKRRMSEYKKANPVIFTEEIRRKISDSKKGDKNPMFGKKFSEEHKSKISESNKNKFHTQESKHKIGLANSIEISQFSLEGEFIRFWSSTMEVERNLDGFKGSGITRVCKGSRKTYKNFIWKYKN